MKYYIGLGNPGNNYRFTPHNLGSLFIAKLIQAKNLIKDGQFWRGNGYTVGYPNTYMNLSGKGIKKLYASSGMNPKQFLSNLIIVHDDIEIPMHVIKEKDGSINNGLGGHNGLRSIVAEFQYLGLTRSEASSFYRIRMGCKAGEQYNLSDYVLLPMSNIDLSKWNDIIIEYINTRFIE